MAIVCPNCERRPGARPGAPGLPSTCPNCERSLLVPDEFGGAVGARPLPEAAAVRAPQDTVRAVGFVPAVLPGPAPGSDGPDEPPLAPGTEVRGYAIARELGRGGMGTVYLATQLSLDRSVALKVMGRRWANDPVFVARFTREAFAAAQLAHPNIVQIYDIGEFDGAHFFSMEYVRGRSLSDLMRTGGKLDPETAVGYVLQAARGLKHAHDRGMIHRDVKPDNLLLDDQGVVKVADLGLVKTPAVAPADDRSPAPGERAGLHALPPDMTGARIALGTPTYMSPEQCYDAASVDHRADIYSLGCTLYVLVTGRPPFDGTTAVELMSKHAHDPLVPPEQIVARVPREISGVIQRMMAKSPGDRYGDMGEVVRTLEAWLGVHRAGTFSPHEEQISRLETYVLRFNTCGPAVLRDRLVSGFFSAIALAAVLLAFCGQIPWAFGTFGLALQATLAYFVLDGVTRKGPLFGCTCRFLAGMGRADWVVGLSAFAMFCVLLALLDVLWIWVGFGLIGAGLALGFRYSVDRALTDERKGVIDGCERLLRRMRARGLGEEELRQFVAKFAGRQWEEFYEALFGYEAKLAARAVLLRGGAAGARDTYAAWREPLIATMERIETGRKEGRARRLLLAVERANLLATGLSAESAESHAKAAADAMVRAANEIRRGETVRAVPEGRSDAGPADVRALVRATARPDGTAAARDPLGTVVGLLVGPYVRVAAAAVLLAACALWAQQNDLFSGAVGPAPIHPPAEPLRKSAVLDANRVTAPLRVPGVPARLLSWADGFNVGLAGLVLLASLCFRGNLMSVFVLIGAVVAIAGHQFGIRTVEPFRNYHISLMLGSLLALVGFRLGTR